MYFNFCIFSSSDQKFFDPKYIFKELPVETAKQKLLILQDPSKQKKAKAEGYAEGEKMSLYRTVNMTDFLNSEDPVIVLNECSEVRPFSLWICVM